MIQLDRSIDVASFDTRNHSRPGSAYNYSSATNASHDTNVSRDIKCFLWYNRFISRTACLMSPTQYNTIVSIIYLSFTPHFVTPWFLRSVYVLNAQCIQVYWHTHVGDLQLHTLGWTSRTTVKIIDKDRYRWMPVFVNNLHSRKSTVFTVSVWLNPFTHGINGFSLLRQWSCIAAQQLANAASVCESEIRNDQWTDFTAVLWHL